MPNSINEILSIIRQIINETGRRPTRDELVKRLGISMESICKMIVSVGKDSSKAMISDEMLSLIHPIDDKDLISAIEALICEDSMRDLVNITSREQFILRERFGIDADAGCSLEEVVQRFLVTRERIRQIEAKALHKPDSGADC